MTQQPSKFADWIARSKRRLHDFRDSHDVAAKDSRSSKGWKIYKALDTQRQEIRVLLIKPGKGRDRLQCELKQAFLTSDPLPKYETISYCWGDSHEKRPISLNGRAVDIPNSAEVVLRRTRLAESERVVWIDAVCINQDDVDERSQQVALMYQVYSKTFHNLIWLGEEDDTTKAAFDQIAQIVGDACVETEDFTRYQEIWSDSKRFSEEWMARRLEIFSDPNALLSLFSRPWFRRLWIVQEAALPTRSTCYCGVLESSLRDVLRTAAWFLLCIHCFPAARTRWRRMGFTRASDLFTFVEIEHGNLSGLASDSRYLLGNVFSQLAAFEATDPRDHIYGTLGIYQALAGVREIHPMLIPDYQKPVRTVYRDATRYITAYAWNNLFHFHWLDPAQQLHDKMDSRDLPTWAIHWDHDFASTGSTFGQSFDAHGGLRLDCDPIRACEDADLLPTTGFVVDRVADVSSVILDQDTKLWSTSQQALREIHSFVNGFVDLSKASRVSVSRFLIAEQNHRVEGATEEDVLDGVEWTEYMAIPADTKLSDAKSWRMAQYDRAFRNTFLQRRVFATSRGIQPDLEYAGIGPGRMEAGDLIVILFGCKWPVVLRPHGEHFKLIGICYIKGIMHGEEARRWRTEGRASETFILE